jgi:hypothetical protein
LTLPVTTPVLLFGVPTVVVTVGTLLVGLMVTVTVVVTTPRRPSATVTVKESVVRVDGAFTVDAACLAAAVGV